MPRLRADGSLLVVVDTQPGFYRDRDDVDSHLFTAFVGRVAWIVSVASALDVPIVVTVERPERNGPTAETVTDALPAGTAVFDKTTFDLTADWPIRSAVERLDRWSAVLVGMETDVCVAQSAMGLRDLGLRTAVVVDATFAPGAAHAHGMDRMRGAGVEAVSTKGLFYEWLPSLDALREFKRVHPDLARPSGIQL